MKIGVNARLLAEPYTGIGRYTQHLFNKLAELHPEDEFTLVTYKKIEQQFPPNVKITVIPEKKWLFSSSLKKGYWEKTQIQKFFNQKVSKIAPSSRSKKHFGSRGSQSGFLRAFARTILRTTAWRGAREGNQPFPSRFNQNKFDLIHSTYPTPTRELKAPLITTIHDVIPFKNPEYQRRLRTRIYLNSIRKAVPGQQFLAVSETTRKEAIEHLGIPEDRITTTYEAASETYLKESRQNEIAEPPYLLYVGGYDARKNVDYLCQVFSTIQPLFPDLKLVLAGGKLFNSKLYGSHDLPKNLEKGKINLLRTGFIEEQELNALYRGATALINLSQQEGLNLPILEAAYTGTPVITSDIEVHRELYKNHVLLLPLDDPEKASTALKEFLENTDLQQKFRDETAALREKYTWESAAQKTYKEYGRVTSNH